MRRPLPSLVLAMACANFCAARPRPQSNPQDIGIPGDNPAATVHDCSESTRRAQAAPGVNSSETAKLQNGKLAKLLVEKFNSQSHAIGSMEAQIHVVAMAGPSYRELAQYSNEVDAEVFAQRPASLRFLVVLPSVGRTLFDLAGDGDKFQIAVPSRHEFLMGRYGAAGRSNQPLENIRPQHLLDALIWPEFSDDRAVRLEPPSQKDDRSTYTLIVSKKDGTSLERLISFDGVTLQVKEIKIYGSDGHQASEIRFDEWMSVSGDPRRSAELCFPRHIWIHRIKEDYQLELHVNRIRVNEEFRREQFHLAIASGMRPVDLESGAAKSDP